MPAHRFGCRSRRDAVCLAYGRHRNLRGALRQMMSERVANENLLGTHLKDSRAKLNPSALGFSPGRRRPLFEIGRPLLIGPAPGPELIG